MFDKVLVANRGEIALRIMRTLKRMNIRTVAIYSEADTNALHVQYADEAIYIGPSPATESYLSIKNILAAVRQSGAQAVHPGYGFLSENSAFAEELVKEGVTLIGPSVEAIRSMGDKIEAKKAAQKAKVSIVPGDIAVITSIEQAVEIALVIGFPIMLKAVAGGGGRGMRVVRSEEEVREAFRSAANEARNSFSDGRIFIEKFIENPRHIEIQLLADQYGNYICLGERECSIQRHHQKVIEEAPSSLIDDNTRAKMYEQTIALAKQVNYYSAGTVEFIVDPNKNFYFLEMNTRLQVEHCVTELVTGIDIVEQMVRIAAGEQLLISQDDVVLNGWAMESRIYAEDPTRGFLPSSGRITQYEEPAYGIGLRIDSGVDEGSEVSMFYDPMIAKLCSYGNTRLDAIEMMQKALGDFVIAGISHNISFLEAIMKHSRFIGGDISTKFIEEEYPEGFLGAGLDSETTRVFLAVAIHISLTDTIRTAQISGQVSSQRVKISTRWVVNIDGQLYAVLIKPAGRGFNIRFENEKLFVRSDWILGTRLFRGMVNNKPVSVKIENTVSGYILTHAGSSVNVTVRSPRAAELEKFMSTKPASRHNNKELIAPLAGMIVKIKVQENDEIEIGQDLLTMEAMKMENAIKAESKAVVDKIFITEGESVAAGQLLLTFR